jgi:hypothetical protein
MFIVVQHQISNPEKFWETVMTSDGKIPSELKLHSTLPNSDGTKAVCLWEASDLYAVKNAVENLVGQFSRNEYFSVETKNAFGLPQ